MPSYAKKSFADQGAALDTAVSRTGVSGENLTSLPAFIGNGIRAALSLVAVIFFILMFYGGMRWFTSRGEEDAVKHGRDTISAALIGLLLVVGAYAVTNLVQDRIISGNQSVGAGAGGDSGGEPGAPGCCLDAIQDAGANIGFSGVDFDLGFSFVYAAYIRDRQGCSTRQADDALAGAEGSYWFWFPETGGDMNKCNEIFITCFDDAVVGQDKIADKNACAQNVIRQNGWQTPTN
ncbi:hypothetical protein H6758_02915 [Candidatus Nomurabacteria bacterium]|nr:hypothetical protein [Candidatus Nomurabacteria bacterium]